MGSLDDVRADFDTYCSLMGAAMRHTEPQADGGLTSASARASLDATMHIRLVGPSKDDDLFSPQAADPAGPTEYRPAKGDLDERPSMPHRCCVSGLADPADLPGFAVRVEELGFDTLWVIEDCSLSGGLAMAATALAVTESIGVGVGLLPVPLRNPAIMAMEIATITRMHPGRFAATPGHGVAEWMQQIGALPTHRLAALSETAAAIRKLLAGETVSVIGTHVKLSQVALEQAPHCATGADRHHGP